MGNSGADVRERDTVDVDVRELGGSNVVVHVKLDSSEVQSAFDRTYQALSNRGGIKGFRPGKVPRSVLERHYDREAIRAAAYEMLLQERFEEACREHDLQPMTSPHLEIGPPPDEDEALAEIIKSKAGVDTDDEEAEDETPVEEEESDADDEIPLVEGEPFEFHTVFTARPRPKLPDLSELKLYRPIAEVTDEQVQQRLELLQEINANEVEVERTTVEEGDLVTADVVIVAEGEEPSDDDVQQQDFVVGQRTYDPPIDREMIGREVGDTVELPVELPEDEEDGAATGRNMVMRATIKSVRGRELPELNDEFARSVGDYQTLDDLRASIREQLKRDAEGYAMAQMRSQVLRFLLERTEIDLPESTLEQAAENSEPETVSVEVERLGIALPDFIAALGLDVATFYEDERRRAEGLLTLYFALDKLIEERAVEPTGEDVAEEIMRISRETGMDPNMVQQAATLQREFSEQIAERARRRAVLRDIIAEAEIEDIAPEQYEEMRARELASPGDEDETQSGEAEPDGDETSPTDDVDADGADPTSESADEDDDSDERQEADAQ
ncbi:MAG: trigger factor [Armatimonadetes bacterium]|nr:trigger factor [Armatimonadota bacterium]